MADVMFTEAATASGGREGHVKSSDGVIEFDTAMPGTPRAKELESGTTPEKLFAAGYASCFDGALQLVGKKAGKKFESETTANVDFLKDEANGGFKLAVRLQVKGTGIEKSELEELLKQAHDFCPYSKATRGNIDVTLEAMA